MCENRQAQIPDFSKKSGIFVFTNYLGLLYASSLQAHLRFAFCKDTATRKPIVSTLLSGGIPLR